MSAEREYLQKAINASRKCAPSLTAYCVGAVIVTKSGQSFEGYTHETGPHNHAEEEAIKKALDAGADLRGASIYTSMEPCSTRKSKPVSCTELIILNGFGRVIYAYAEPDCFVRCEGTRILREAGVEVEVIADLAPQVEEINSHILRALK